MCQLLVSVLIMLIGLMHDASDKLNSYNTQWQRRCPYRIRLKISTASKSGEKWPSRWTVVGYLDMINICGFPRIHISVCSAV